MVTKEYLQKLTRPELSAYCRDNGIKGYSGKTKADRIKLILSYKMPEKQPNYFIFYHRSGNIGKVKVKRHIYKPSGKEIYERYGPFYSIDGPFKTKNDVIKALKNEGYKDIDIGKILKSHKSVKPLVKKSTKKLKLYIFGSSIRSEGIGDVDFVIVTTSKRNAIMRIVREDTQRYGSNWISQRIFIEDNIGSLPTSFEKIKGFDPWNTPEVLYMIETDKIEGHIISWRKVPIIIKKWGSSGVSTLRKEYIKKESKKIISKPNKPTKKFKNFDEFFEWFKYNIAKDLKLAYIHDWRKNDNFETGEEYIEVFMEHDLEKIINALKKYNIKVEIIQNKETNNYNIYLKYYDN